MFISDKDGVLEKQNKRNSFELPSDPNRKAGFENGS